MADALVSGSSTVRCSGLTPDLGTGKYIGEVAELVDALL